MEYAKTLFSILMLEQHRDNLALEMENPTALDILWWQLERAQSTLLANPQHKIQMLASAGHNKCL